jgi:hypothetical protein
MLKVVALTFYSEVRFKNNGLDLIEVQDNGTGISPENYENVGELRDHLTGIPSTIRLYYPKLQR